MSVLNLKKIKIYGCNMIITDSFQNAKFLKMFKDFVVQGQGPVNWFSMILEDRTFFEDYNTVCM